MQVLLLSSNTGQGHNACAAALREEFLLRGINCDIVDALTFLSPAVSRFVCGGHVQMYRHFPAVFRRGYHYAEQTDHTSCNGCTSCGINCPDGCITVYRIKSTSQPGQS